VERGQADGVLDGDLLTLANIADRVGRSRESIRRPPAPRISDHPARRVERVIA
jgi:hypothetical protein